MKSIRSSLVASTVLSALVLSGCGGAGGDGPGSGGRGNLTFTVQWPDRTRMIPNAANAIRIRIFPEGANVGNPGNAVGSRFVVRPGGLPGEVTVSLDEVAAGTYEVVAEGFEGRNDNSTPGDDSDDTPIGAALSRGQGQAAILAGNSTPFTVTMNPELARMRVTIRSTSETSAATNLPNTGVVTNVAGNYNPEELYFIEAAPQNAAGTALLLPTAQDLELTFNGAGGMQVLAQQADTSGVTPVARAVFAASSVGTAGFQINYFDGGGASTGRIQMTFRGRINIQDLNVGAPDTLTPAGTVTDLLDVGIDDFGVANGWILARGASANQGEVTGINGGGTALSAPTALTSTGNFGVVGSGRIDGDYVLSQTSDKIGRVSGTDNIDLASAQDVAQLDGNSGAAGAAYFLSGSGSDRSISRGTGALLDLTTVSLSGTLSGFNNLAVGSFFDSGLNQATPAFVAYVANDDVVRQFVPGAGTQPQMINELTGTDQTFAQVVDDSLANGSVTDIAGLGSLLYVLSEPNERIYVFNVRGAKLKEIPLPTNAGGVDYTRMDVGFGSNRAIVVLRDNNTAIRLPITIN